ncbi:Glutamine--fructose-6-phosphate aminotransferase [isomerizing] 2 [Thelohanellus kitauei]|uniref:Glutamine--fructose-6-phosphate aminotransferase [isomerizing] 2 n=1 Tax=Thelohanellus kitauei TaxID=669202 RepID=A0A0C2MAB9_THEKT|nr:Glutamine--fructose-6-phosphate aminotransferase [isomerizing] 2 [Thelohanellus kitauei]
MRSLLGLVKIIRNGSPLMVGIKARAKNVKHKIPIIYDRNFSKNLTLETDVHEIVSGCEIHSQKGMLGMFLYDSSIIDHTKQVVYLEDGDVAHIKDRHLYIQRYHQSQNERVLLEETQTMKMELPQIMMGPYDSFIEKKIFEKPESLLNTTRGRVNFVRKTIKLDILEENRHIAHCGRIKLQKLHGCSTIAGKNKRHSNHDRAWKRFTLKHRFPKGRYRPLEGVGEKMGRERIK